MNKSLKFSIAVIVVLLIYLFYQDQNSRTLINEVLIKEAMPQNPGSNQSNLLKDKNQKEKKVDQKNIILQKPVNSKDNRDISYLTAYREMIHFRKCLTLYTNKAKGVDLLYDYI